MTGFKAPWNGVRHRALRRGFVLGGLASLAGLVPRRSLALGSARTPMEADPSFWSQPRVVRVRNMDTRQQGEFVYWRDGRYVMDEYYALCALGLDHHAKKAVQIAPQVFDLMFATQAWFFGAERKRTMHELTSMYRTPDTNKSVGGSPKSQHILGRAADGRLQGVSVGVYAAMLMSFKAGGVGLYANHVHWDVGRPPEFWRGRKKES